MASEHDIIVVDDHPLFRRGVIQLLKMDPSFNVVAEAGDFEAAMVAVRERDPDIVLLDLNMKHTSGVEILTAIKTFDPSIRVIMLTVSDSPSDLLQCFQNGADGYLLKDQEPEQILEDIQRFGQSTDFYPFTCIGMDRNFCIGNLLSILNDVKAVFYTCIQTVSQSSCTFACPEHGC